MLFTWASISSRITSLFSLLMSHTHINSTSLYSLKNCFLILCTKLNADFPLGTQQFSMSQKTPMGASCSEFDAEI